MFIGNIVTQLHYSSATRIDEDAILKGHID